MRAAERRRERMRAVVGAIAGYQARHGFTPSVREVRTAAGLGSLSQTAHWLDACERAGLIVRVRRIARAITLTEAGRALAGSPAEERFPPVPGRPLQPAAPRPPPSRRESAGGAPP